MKDGRTWILAACTAALAVAFACTTNIPANPEQNLCDGQHLHATRDDPNACTHCLESSCCDEIGDCERNDQCRAGMLEAHACLIDAGALAARPEIGDPCRSGLVDAGAFSTYTCMHDHCPKECGLVVCKLDPLVPATPSPACDDCFAQACCEPLNACAGDRRCLLFLECILNRCKDSFGNDLVPANVPESLIQESLTCLDGGTPPMGPPDVPAEPQTCINECFGRFIGQGDFSGTDRDRLQSACLANRTFSCGARQNCRDRCLPDAGTPPPDAGTDASDASPDAPDAADAGDAD